jgi:predicted Na+-dependent transporter
MVVVVVVVVVVLVAAAAEASAVGLLLLVVVVVVVVVVVTFLLFLNIQTLSSFDTAAHIIIIIIIGHLQNLDLMISASVVHFTETTIVIPVLGLRCHLTSLLTCLVVLSQVLCAVVLRR